MQILEGRLEGKNVLITGAATAMPDQGSSKWGQPQQVAPTIVRLESTPNLTCAVIPIYGGEL
jgi:NAD(P)-dependent dehydrogenase (short-subunit alcohol dehydrogenase family)